MPRVPAHLHGVVPVRVALVGLEVRAEGLAVEAREDPCEVYLGCLIPKLRIGSGAR